MLRRIALSAVSLSTLALSGAAVHQRVRQRDASSSAAAPTPSFVAWSWARLSGWMAQEAQAQEVGADSGRAPGSVKYLIVGGGVAALHAVRAIRELDASGSILVLDSSAMGPAERPPISKEALWHGVSTDALAFRLPHEDAARTVEVALPSGDAHLTWRCGVAVTDLDPDAKAVLVGGSNDNPESGEVVFFDKCLLATGSAPRRVREFTGTQMVQEWDDAPIEPGSPITVLRGAEDLVRLRSAMPSVQHVAVVGGGVPAAELAVGLRRAYPDKRVSVIFKDEALLADMLPSDVAAKVTAEVARHGVELHPSTKAHVLDRSRPGAPVVIFSDSSDVPPLEADHVILAVGDKPATQFAELAQLELDTKNGGIVVNGELLARSDIYAAGDVASYYDAKLGRRTQTSSYDHAAMSGRVAGRNMAGKREMYLHTPMFWTQIGDLRIETVGRTDSSLQTVGVWDERGRGAPNDAQLARGVVYYVEANRIVGVLLCNVDAQVDNARKIVQRRKLYYDKKILLSLISIE
jgi:apoptosis-inducing factor 1